MKIVEVYFDYNNTYSYCKSENLALKKNVFVVVSTNKGLQVGKIIDFINDLSKFDNVDLNSIVRVTSKKDYFQYLENKKLERTSLDTCKKLVLKNKLPMTILDSHYSFDRSQLIFRFVADERVDFRQLARELGTIFRTRIELRQIGIRDKAKEIGGIGPCGRLLCCSSFLKTFDSVTINMAKNQNVSLNPSKINGLCGRLLCCLRYENTIYTESRKKFPKVGSYIDSIHGKAKVISINVIQGKYVIELENKNRIEVDCNDSKE